jgi:hypothetical protein
MDGILAGQLQYNSGSIENLNGVNMSNYHGMNYLNFTRGAQNYQAMVHPVLKIMNGTFTQDEKSYPFNAYKI